MLPTDTCSATISRTRCSTNGRMPVGASLRSENATVPLAAARRSRDKREAYHHLTRRRERRPPNCYTSSTPCTLAVRHEQPR